MIGGKLSARTVTLLCGAAALTVLVAGCGGGGGDESTSGEPLTKAEFIARGDEICRQGDAAIEEEANEFAEEHGIDTNKPSEADEEELVSAVAAPAFRSQAEEIGELTAPRGEDAKVEAMVEALTEGAEELEAEPELLLESKNPLEKSAKLAQEFGFTVCGSE